MVECGVHVMGLEGYKVNVKSETIEKYASVPSVGDFIEVNVADGETQIFQVWRVLYPREGKGPILMVRPEGT